MYYLTVIFVVVSSANEETLYNNLSMANSITNINNNHSPNKRIVIETPSKQKKQILLTSTTCKFIPLFYFHVK